VAWEEINNKIQKIKDKLKGRSNLSKESMEAELKNLKA
jgi:hypothetical protein